MQRRFSIGWVLISYLMIAGGLMFAAVVVMAAEATGEWVSQAVMFAGAFVGGLFAGRASPGKTVAEPGLAGVLLILTVFGVCSLVPGSTMFSIAGTGGPAVEALKLAFVAGLGGFVGGLLGERTSRGRQSASAWRWWGVSSLVTVGLTYVVLGLFALIALRSGDGFSDSAIPAVAIGAMALGTFGSGFIVQAVAPRSMRAACGGGALGMMAFVLVVNAALGSFDGMMAVGALIVGGLATLVGLLGAGLSWRLVGSRRAPRPPDLPEARVQ